MVGATAALSNILLSILPLSLAFTPTSFNKELLIAFLLADVLAFVFNGAGSSYLVDITLQW